MFNFYFDTVVKRFKRLVSWPEDGAIERFQGQVNGSSRLSQNDPSVCWYSFTSVLSGQIRIASDKVYKITFLSALQIFFTEISHIQTV